MSLRTRLYQAGIVVPAALLTCLFLHWLITQQQPLFRGSGEVISAARMQLNIWPAFLFGANTLWPGYRYFLTATLGLMAITGLVACALAATIAIRVPEQIAARRLSWSLVAASFGACYIFFVTTHEYYRSLIGWTPTSPARLLFDGAAYSALLLSPLFLARFFLSYPRNLGLEEWETEIARDVAKTREDMQTQSGWRRWLNPARLRTMNMPHSRPWIRLPSDAEEVARSMLMFRASQSNTAIAIIVCWAILCAIFDWLGASQATEGGNFSTGIVAFPKFILSASWILSVVLAVATVSKTLQLNTARALPEDRRKIDWIRSTVFVGGIMAGCVISLGQIIMIFALNWIGEKTEIFPPGELMITGPLFIAGQLFIIASVISLALSIFYRGAIDPRLAARKITVFGVLGLIVAFLFVLIERTVALKIVAYFNLAPDTGALIAGACVAATVAPIKNHAEKGINAFVGRFLPLDSMIEGEKKVLVVALSDLSGYTSLSSRDEKQALLLAALLHRQANKLVDAHGGRVVKSMGDAVMFAFDEPASAVNVLTALHRDFAPAAEQLGIAALLVHSGAHMGEVTISLDGDLYGQTVNIAARIQGAAEPGQIVVSDAIAAAAGSAACRDLGPRQFKNVPQAIACHELTHSDPAPLRLAIT